MDLFDDLTNHLPIPTTSTTGKGNRKLRRSCELCRNTKARCCPTKDNTKCQKCAKEGKECIFLEAKLRPKRAKNSRIMVPSSRVAEMEEKLDVIFALLAGPQAAKDLNPTPFSKENTPPEKHYEVTPTPFLQPNLQGQTESTQLPAYYQVLPQGDYSLDDFQDSISKYNISIPQAEEFVDLFKRKMPRFPFVVIPPHASLDSLRRERPFLLLSIFVLSSQKKYKLQEQLELELKETLSKRVLVGGEKTLDILQGLLLYLAWYHMHFKSDRQQIYTLLQLAVSMSIDMEINKPRTGTCYQFMVGPINFACPDFTPAAPENFLDELETKRTYLGCYYISSAVSQGFRKPGNMKYCEFTKDCCQVLAQSGVAETDYLLPYLIRLQQISDDVKQAFDYDNIQGLPELDVIRIEVLKKSFEDQLKDFENTIPVEVWSNSMISLAYYSQRIYVHEIGFHAIPPPSHNLTSTRLSHHSWYHSSSRNDSLLRCASASKDYLEQILSISPPEFLNFILPDFLRLVYAILIIGSFNATLDAPTLDHTSAREITNVEYYLDSLIIKIGEVIPSGRENSHNPFMLYLNRLLRRYKIWFSTVHPKNNSVDVCFTGNPCQFRDIVPEVLRKSVEWDCVVDEWEGEGGGWDETLNLRDGCNLLTSARSNLFNLWK